MRMYEARVQGVYRILVLVIHTVSVWAICYNCICGRDLMHIVLISAGLQLWPSVFITYAKALTFLIYNL